MCGTPFPYRSFTVPEAQSTLAFASAPLEIAPTLLHPPVTEVSLETPVAELVELPLEEASVDVQVAEPEESAEAVVPVAEVLAEEPVAVVAEEPVVEPHEIVEPEPELVESAADAAPGSAIAEVAEEQAAPVDEVEPEAVLEVETPLSVEQPAAVEEIPVAAEPVVGAAEPAAVEPVPEAVTAAAVSETLPKKPADVAAEEPAHEAATEEVEPEAQKPAARVIVMPTERPRQVALAASVAAPASPAIVHPSPDTLTFTPPPASSGMPTFQEVVEAAGAPPISPFEPPAETHTDEDRELQEYVARFRYTPPAETADELTMRGEVPLIDKAAPEQFHHPSFDDDVPPPPEAGPHPTGEEYYPPSHVAVRPHFLEISDEKPGADEGAFPAMRGDESVTAPRSKWWLWTAIVAIVVVFGGLGFLEGRAQSTNAFRGPVEVVRDAYHHLRARLAQPEESPTARAENRASDDLKQTDKRPKPEAANTAPAAQSNVPAEKSAEKVDQAQPSPSPAGTESRPAANITAPVETAKAIQPPPAPKPSAKPQPGQQELDKAMNASDPTAAAAWLWKATSRGNPEAPVRLADMYIKGNGVPKSCEQAMVLLRSAATKENAPARNRLAALYANGTCVARDRVKAYQLISSALVADPSSEWAKENREALWNQMTPEERAEAQKYR